MILLNPGLTQWLWSIGKNRNKKIELLNTICCVDLLACRKSLLLSVELRMRSKKNHKNNSNRIINNSLIPYSLLFDRFIFSSFLLVVVAVHENMICRRLVLSVLFLNNKTIEINKKKETCAKMKHWTWTWIIFNECQIETKFT